MLQKSSILIGETDHKIGGMTSKFLKSQWSKRTKSNLLIVVQSLKLNSAQQIFGLDKC